ncbi:hypothetical protein BYT27DRAFT_7104806, partial [Phlegmacium glaucopus]
QVCRHNGFCKKHQLQCSKVFYYKGNTTEVPKRCKECDREGDNTQNEEQSVLEPGIVKLGEGGYNDVFLISSVRSLLDVNSSPFGDMKPFVLRLPKQESLLPYQVLNEITCISIVSSNCPDIPVPVVHAFATDTSDAFIAEEYIHGEPLSSCWNRFSETEKGHVAQRIAEIIVDMGEMRFDGIGGFTGGKDCLLGPTVEGSKLFKGRSKFHSNNCYDIGPYKSTKEYVLACYDKEIYYYTHASASDIDSDLFEDMSVERFVAQLRDKRSFLEVNYNPVDEPFVLVHGDFNGRNILMGGSDVVAVLDWEFSGAYPLSELVGGVGMEVLEVIDGESEKENSMWSARILRMVASTARKRHWPENEVGMLVGSGDPIVGYARTEMFPVE